VRGRTFFFFLQKNCACESSSFLIDPPDLICSCIYSCRNHNWAYFRVFLRFNASGCSSSMATFLHSSQVLCEFWVMASLIFGLFSYLRWLLKELRAFMYRGKTWPSCDLSALSFCAACRTYSMSCSLKFLYIMAD
jgi:hypothetical protein